MDATAEHDRILVGVDGSSSSIDALRHAARLAEALGAPLEVVTTWTYPLLYDPETALTGWSPQTDAHETLDRAVRDAFGKTPPIGLTRTVLFGPAARTLIEESATSGMLVVGSRGRGGFTGLLLGSVSAACAEHAQCPVLVVRPRATPQGQPTA